MYYSLCLLGGNSLDPYILYVAKPLQFTNGVRQPTDLKQIYITFIFM